MTIAGRVSISWMADSSVVMVSFLKGFHRDKNSNLPGLFKGYPHKRLNSGKFGVHDSTHCAESTELD